MAPLIFKYGGGELSCELRKVERAHLYGSVRTEVSDAGGLKCRLATLAADGHTIIDSGGTALAYLSPENGWLDKAALKAVDLQGREMTPVGSSFKAPIDLSTKATVEEYLSHSIHACYLLGAALPEDLMAELKAGTIYTFCFSWRGGLQADCGFLLAGADGVAWLMVGKKQEFAFIGLEQADATAVEDEVAEDEDDSMDFGMM